MPLDPDYDLFLRVAAAGSLSAAARATHQSPAQVSKAARATGGAAGRSAGSPHHAAADADRRGRAVP
ncbi:hypothetical protein AB5I41_12560 [Sphingomonas sp. MMS24-JH45]